MKTTLLAVAFTILATGSLVAQNTSMNKIVDHQQHMQVMAMLKDSSATDMLLSNIASDRLLRIRVAEKIAEYTEKDTTARHEVCSTLMKGMMMNEGGSGCGMMKHGMMDGMNKQEMQEQEKQNQDKMHKH